jgi:hypothetical protein
MTFSFHNGEGNNHNFLYLSKDIMDVSFHCERKMSYLQDMSGTLLRKIIESPMAATATLLHPLSVTPYPALRLLKPDLYQPDSELDENR